MEKKLQNHLDWFNGWVDKKITAAHKDTSPLELKKTHSHNVLKNALAIAENEPEMDRECVYLSALYHDLARFDQYLQFTTFKDSLSFNHGSQAVKILKQENRLDDCSQEKRKIILSAIGLHNHPSLPASLPTTLKKYCQLLRDADKLDILRVIDEHLASNSEYNPTVILSLPDSAEPGNPLVTAKTLARELAFYSDLQTLNDFRVLLGSWFFDMNFKGSQSLFVEEGHAISLLLGLPDDAHYGKARNFLLGELEKHAR